MKTIGLIGGMSWQSTMPYYQIINETVAQALGGLHSAKIILWNMNFQQIADYQKNNQWDEAGQRMTEAAVALQNAGAEAIVICTNTMHKSIPEMRPSLTVPILHIVDAAGEAIVKGQHRKVGLLGTKFTMEQGFYANHLRECYGLDVVTPNAAARQIVHDVIFNELCQGITLEYSRNQYREIIAGLIADGADCILLGCTEIAMLVDQSDAAVPVYDSTELHAKYAADWSLSEICAEIPDNQ